MRLHQLIAASAVLLAGTAAAKTIVVKATGPSAAQFPTGKILKDGARLKLKAGDRLTVIDPRGTRLFTGARDVDLAATAPTDTRVTSLVGGRYGGRRNAVGGLRGAKPAPSAAATTAIAPVSITLAGRQCVVSGGKIALKRTIADAPAAYTLAGRANGATASVDFAAGALSADWPVDKLPVQSGARYAVGGAGAGGEIELIVLQGQAADDIAWAELLVKNGCASQLEALAGL